MAGVMLLKSIAPLYNVGKTVEGDSHAKVEPIAHDFCGLFLNLFDTGIGARFRRGSYTRNHPTLFSRPCDRRWPALPKSISSRCKALLHSRWQAYPMDL